MDYLQFKEQLNKQRSLQHHSIKGQRWGIRRFQNEDGSLTPEGEERYGISSEDFKKVKDADDAANKKVYDAMIDLRKMPAPRNMESANSPSTAQKVKGFLAVIGTATISIGALALMSKYMG